MATTPSLEKKTPFDSILQNVPQGHEKALKGAFYNTAANLFVLFACAAAVAVFYILEAFLRPLLWAVLCGTFLYPFKRSLTNVLRSWLTGLHTGGTPFFVGLLVIPVRTLDRTSDTIINTIWEHLKPILAALVGIPLLYVLWHFGQVRNIIQGVQTVFMFMYEVLGYFSSLWIWTILIGYLLVVVFCWSPDSKRYLRYLSIPVWVTLILHIATAAGALRVPLLICIVTVMIIGFVTEVNEVRRLRSLEDGIESPSAIETALQLFVGESDTEPSPESSRQQSPEKAVDREEKKLESTPKEPLKPSTLRLQGQRKDDPRPERKESVPQVSSECVRSLSDQCFIGLFWALVLTRLWMNMWIIYVMLPVTFALWGIKYLGTRLASKEGVMGKKVQKVKASLSAWVHTRREVLMPRWIRGLGKLVLKGDSKIISVLEQSLDKATSILFILLLLVGTVLLSVFFAVQVQQESIHLVKVTSNLLNNTLHPEITGWLPNGEDMQKAMDSMVGNAYLYGRNWIAAKVRDMVNGQGGNNTHIEKQVIEVWDQLYESWLARAWLNKNASSTSVTRPSSQDGMSLKSVWDVVSQGHGFKIGAIVDFIKENIGTLTSVFESVWMVLKGNMNLIFSGFTATLSLVFGGGTALLNFVISAAIFLTTMFYLLASSGDTYKPMELFSSMSPTEGGSRLGQAVEEAISGVVMASLKMAAFYGLYTWLTHSVFGINIVFIPSALAAIFAAVPFLGTYWAALPAVLELWLVQKEGVLAILLFVCHMLPTYVVDTAIYSEIKGGHPYMTGLAIAGGMYWMGLEGAIIGPILLCCLIVAINVYRTMLQPDAETPQVTDLVPGGFPWNRSFKPYMRNMPRSVSTDVMKL